MADQPVGQAPAQAVAAAALKAAQVRQAAAEAAKQTYESVLTPPPPRTGQGS